MKQRLKALYHEANGLWMKHFNAGGTADYSDKNFGQLLDDLERVETGYFKFEPDSEFSQQLWDEGFTMTEEEAFITLSHRVSSIKKELGNVKELY